MSPFNNSRFANAAHNQASSYERRFRKYVPFSEVIDTLRRQADFDRPLKFVVDQDEDSVVLRKRGPRWEFGAAGIRFERAQGEGAHNALVVKWEDGLEQKTMQDLVAELASLGFSDDDEVSFELVSPTGERLASRFGVSLTVEGGNVVHFTGAWKAV